MKDTPTMPCKDCDRYEPGAIEADAMEIHNCARLIVWVETGKIINPNMTSEADYVEYDGYDYHDNRNYA